MTRLCTRCREPFEPAARYHRLCWRCWRAERDEAAAAEEYHHGYNDGVKAAMRSTLHQAAPRQLDAGVLREAIALCHPDRHPAERTETANRVTAALLEQWNGERQKAA